MKKATTLEELRVKIAAAQARRTELKSAPLAHAEVRVRLNDWATTESNERRRLLAYHAANDPGSALRLRASPDGVVDLGPVLCALLGPATVAGMLASMVESSYADTPGSADRAAELAEIDSELDRLEREEEREVCRLEVAGQRVVRRADARPEIVLEL